MKIYKGTIAFRLAVDIYFYGNIPYHALKLYPYDYESTKDAIQKLIRAGDVAVIKAKKSKTLRQNIKILHTTPQGREAVEDAYIRMGKELQPPAPIAYQVEKVYRAGLASETKVLLHKSGCSNFLSSQHIKNILEENMRGSGSIKYSRFIGFWNRDSICTVIYHFGDKNMLLKENGEKNSRQAAKGLADKEVDSLILGDSMETLRAILDYSIWFNRKPKNQRQYIRKLLFHIDLATGRDDDIAFLPVSRAAMPVIRMMANKNWSESIQHIYKAYFKDGFSVWSLLNCRIKPWVLHWMSPPGMSNDSILILCYDWQESLVRDFFQEITDRKEIWLQILDSQTVEDWFFGKIDTLPYAPIRLKHE